MHQIVVTIIFLLSIFGLKAQDDHRFVELADSMHMALANLDNIGRLYAITEKNSILAYDSSDKLLFQYANQRNGDISDIDVSNPLQLLVFYDDFNIVKTFDNTLSVIETWDINDFFMDPSAVASSNDGNYWVYDVSQYKLYKVDQLMNVVVESSNTHDFGMDGAYVMQIRERGNFVILCDPEQGFFIFDNLGQHIRNVKAKDIDFFQFDGEYITYFSENKFYACHVKYGLPEITNLNGDLFLPTKLNEFQHSIFSDAWVIQIYPNGYQRVFRK